MLNQKLIVAGALTLTSLASVAPAAITSLSAPVTTGTTGHPASVKLRVSPGPINQAQSGIQISPNFTKRCAVLHCLGQSLS